MKKILVFICLALFTAANSQSLEINTISGGVEIVRTSTNDTLQYTDGASLYAMIDNNNSLRIYQKLGGRVFSPYLFTDVEVDGVAFTDKKTMLSAINQIPAFSLYEVCVDSGEVLGNFLYLFSCDDTTIIDVSGISVQGDSLWTISSGKYEQIYNIPFNQNFQGYKLINDSINLGPVKLPYVGVMGPDLGSYKSAVAYVDATGAGSTRVHSMGYTDFLGAKYNSIAVNDTSAIYIRSRGDIFNEAVGRFSVTPNERFLVNTDTITMGASGAILNLNVVNGSLSIDMNDGLIKTTRSPDDKDWGISFWGDTVGGGSPERSLDLFQWDEATQQDERWIYVQDQGVCGGVKYEKSLGGNFNYNAFHIDSTQIVLAFDSSNGGNSGLDIEFKLDSNGVTLPKMATDPTGEEGAIYYNTTDSLFRGFSYNWATVVLVSDSIYSNNADADNDPNLPSGAGYRISGNRGVLIKP